MLVTHKKPTGEMYKKTRLRAGTGLKAVENIRTQTGEKSNKTSPNHLWFQSHANKSH